MFLANVDVRHVSRRAINLRRILAAESAAVAAPHPAIGIHNNLAPGQPGIAHGPANPTKRPVGLMWYFVSSSRKMSRNRSLNHAFSENVAAQFVVANRLRVLRGNHNRIDAEPACDARHIQP